MSQRTSTTLLKTISKNLESIAREGECLNAALIQQASDLLREAVRANEYEMAQDIDCNLAHQYGQ
jgi:hypothetical protein